MVHIQLIQNFQRPFNYIFSIAAALHLLKTTKNVRISERKCGNFFLRYYICCKTATVTMVIDHSSCNGFGLSFQGVSNTIRKWVVSKFAIFFLLRNFFSSILKNNGVVSVSNSFQNLGCCQKY